MAEGVKISQKTSISKLNTPSEYCSLHSFPPTKTSRNSLLIKTRESTT
jgi:hypothetical protein